MVTCVDMQPMIEAFRQDLKSPSSLIDYQLKVSPSINHVESVMIPINISKNSFLRNH